MTTALEERLRSELPMLADLLMGDERERVAPGAAPLAAPTVADTSGRRARPAVAAIAAAVVIAVAVAAVLLAGSVRESDRRRVDVVPAAPKAPSGEWSRLPDSPLSAREDAIAVWTGSEVIVWGGHRDMLALTDGAAYNPATRTWRSIAPNTWGHPGAFGLWAGDRVVVLAKNGGATYSPETDGWTGLPRLADDAGVMLTVAVWTGEEVLAAGPRTDTGGEEVLGLVSLDVATGQWRMLSALESGIGDAYRVVASDTGMIVWSQRGGGGTRGWEYDAGADSWDALPPLPVAPGTQIQSAAPAWLDGALHVIVSVRATDGVAPRVKSVVARLDGGEWIVGSDELDFARATDAVAAGDLIVLLDQNPEGKPVVLDPRSGLWSLLGDYPLEAATGRSTAWTDEGLFVWGGRTAVTPPLVTLPSSAVPVSTTVADGAVWTPSGS